MDLGTDNLWSETMNLKCNRCNHSWYSRTPNEPKVCPKCKSPYWNKERVRKL